MKLPIIKSISYYAFVVVYTWLLPFGIMFALFIASPKYPRSPFLGSWILDFLVRLFIAIVFAAGLIVIPRRTLLKSWLWSFQSSRPLSFSMAFFNFFRAIAFGILAGVISGGVARIFLPSITGLNIIIAIVSGLIYGIPFLFQTKDFEF